MSEFLSDKEQEERLKKAIKTNGSWIIGAIALALFIFSGYQYYQRNQLQNQINAATQLEQVMIAGEDAVTALDSETPDTAKNTVFLASVDQLVEAYPKTTQAFEALLMKAKYLVDSGDLAKASTALQQAANIETDEGLRSIALIRLAGLQLELKEFAAAQKTIDGIGATGFEVAREELLGDLAVAQNQPEQAAEAYQRAWEASLAREEDRPELRYKMESVGLSPEPIEQPELILNQ